MLAVIPWMANQWVRISVPDSLEVGLCRSVSEQCYVTDSHIFCLKMETCPGFRYHM